MACYSQKEGGGERMEKDESALFEIVRSAAVVFSVISLPLFFALSALPFVTRAGGASRRGEGEAALRQTRVALL